MDGITNSMDMSLVEFWEILKYREGSHAAMKIENPAARRSNQSILKEIKPEYSLEGLMLKLKFQY